MFIVKAKEGLFQGSIGVMQNQGDYIKIDKVTEGVKVLDYSEYSIDDLRVIGDGVMDPIVIDCYETYANEIVKGYLNNPASPFENFTNDELREIVKIYGYE